MKIKKRKQLKKPENGIMTTKGWDIKGGVMLFKGTHLQLVDK